MLIIVMIEHNHHNSNIHHNSSNNVRGGAHGGVQSPRGGHLRFVTCDYDNTTINATTVSY